MKEKAGTGGVRVATLNLWGRRGEWNERRRVLVEGFRELEPDLVAFQDTASAGAAACRARDIQA